MVFPSVPFAVFFPAVLALSWLLMPAPRVWKPYILAVSYLFYAAAAPRFCLLLAGVTVVNQLGAWAVVKSGDRRGARAAVAATVVCDLGALAYFKYYGFFVSDVDRLLDGAGLGAPLPLLNVALPV